MLRTGPSWGRCLGVRLACVQTRVRQQPSLETELGHAAVDSVGKLMFDEQNSGEKNSGVCLRPFRWPGTWKGGEDTYHTPRVFLLLHLIPAQLQDPELLVELHATG